MTIELEPRDVRALRYERARRSFAYYRRLIHPNMKRGWWQEHAAAELERFYRGMVAGERPKLVLQAPPQHGKSELIVDFVSWVAGQDPDLKTIYASFSERLGVRANLRLQRLYDSPLYAGIFPGTGVNQTNTVSVSGHYLRNREVLEYVGREGYFRNTTVNGSVTGESLDVGVIDDPLKGRAEANSPTVRNRTWEWMMDDFFTRFSNDAGMLSILTRWHTDDPIGRLIEEMSGVRVVSYPALATDGAALPEGDPREPGSGEPLFPEHKSLDFLLERKKAMLAANWEALYQQNPYIVGGGLFAVGMFGYRDAPPAPKYIARSVRYWDKAGTDGGGDWTAGVLMHLLTDGRYVVEDVVRVQASPGERERIIRETAERDGPGVMIRLEQEPGSSGKDSAQATVSNLAGFRAKAERVTGSKKLRAEDYAAQVEGGNVELVRGPWVRDFVHEHELFDGGPHDDQVDAASGAFRALTTGKRKAAW